MEHKQAISVLIKILNKPELNAEEKEAVTTAIGVLGWASLAKARVKAIKAKRDIARKTS